MSFTFRILVRLSCVLQKEANLVYRTCRSSLTSSLLRGLSFEGLKLSARSRVTFIFGFEFLVGELYLPLMSLFMSSVSFFRALLLSAVDSLLFVSILNTSLHCESLT